MSNLFIQGTPGISAHPGLCLAGCEKRSGYINF